MTMERKQTIRYWTYGLFSLYTSFLSPSIQASVLVELGESDFEVLEKPSPIITAIDKDEEREVIKKYDRARESFSANASSYYRLAKTAVSATAKVMRGIDQLTDWGINQIAGYRMAYLTSYGVDDSPNPLPARRRIPEGESWEQMEENLRKLNSEAPFFRKNPFFLDKK
ncbi:MAG: hypothetical protein JNK42_05820 [Caedimonas sp.]|nr:hypothetical protein [Caedimonas sp.]